MQILVLGGTTFVGRAIVDDALRAGHEVTLFNRGRTGTDLFQGVARLVGDREADDYASLAAGAWDAVVDVSAYVPRHIAGATEAIGDRTGRYLFISTGAVYDRFRATPQDGVITESTARLEPVRDTEELTAETYGRLKVACEDDVLARYGDRATIVRPGIVAGPHDDSDRFTWWVRRAARGGRIELAGRPDQPVQVVDSRDLGRLVVALLEADRGGAYNATGPAEPTTMRQLIETCAAAAGTEVEVVPVPMDPDARMPLILGDATWDVMSRRSAALARSVGMPSTPLIDTARDVLAWDRDRGEPPLVTD